MASLYKNNGIWYIAVSHNGTRKCRSLKTKDIKVAKSIKSYAETIILQELGGFIKSNAKLSFSELVDHFLKAPHSWSTATYDLNKYILTSHLDGTIWEESPFNVFIMVVIFGLGDWMIKKLEIVGIIFTATNVIGFFLIKGFYLPCLIGIWLMYSYYQSKKDS